MAKRRTKKWLICETLGCSQQRQGHIVPKPTDAVRLETQRVVILSEIQHVVRGSLYRAEGSGERRTLGSAVDAAPSGFRDAAPPWKVHFESTNAAA